MAEAIKMPKMSDTMTEGVLAKWHKKVGDKVKVGQPLCVLEAMKIMNEIDADINGEIVEICVDNESLVEFGQPLFKIKP